MKIHSTSELKRTLHQAKAIIFDFDGTLVDSNPIKLAGFDACFAQHTEQWNEIRRYCYSNNHTSRGEKFRYVYEKILRQPYTPEIDRQMHEQYAAATTEKVIQAPEIPGAERFLKQCHATHTLELLSATLNPILQQIIQARGWRPYFDQVVGNPVNKLNWIRSFCSETKASPGDVWFVGDTPEDAMAADLAGVPFLGVRLPAEIQTAAFCIDDFQDLLDKTL